MKKWLIAFRPKTLVASFVPVLTATALAYNTYGEVNYLMSLLVLLTAICIQIATNLFNDAIDFKKGADTKERLGPKRITNEGLASENSVFKMAFFFLFLAMVFGLPLVIHGGWPFLIFGAVSVFLAYSYTGGPLPLAYLGLGDLFVLLFFGLLAVGGTFYLQQLELTTGAIVLGLQIGCLATILIIINNIRDVVQDKASNKNTLVVRFGVSFSKIEIYVLVLVSFFLGIYWVLNKSYYSAMLPLLSITLVFSLMVKIYKHSPSKIYNDFLTMAAKIQLVFCLLITLGFVLDR